MSEEDKIEEYLWERESSGKKHPELTREREHFETLKKCMGSFVGFYFRWNPTKLYQYPYQINGKALEISQGKILKAIPIEFRSRTFGLRLPGIVFEAMNKRQYIVRLNNIKEIII